MTVADRFISPTPHRLGSSRARSPALGLALGIALLAQNWVDKRVQLGLASVVYVLAAFLYALAARPTIRTREEQTAFQPSRPLNVSHLLWALAFGGLAFASLGHNRFTFQGFLAWVIGLALCFSAMPPSKESRTARDLRQRLSAGRWCLPWSTLALIAATLVGAYLRLYQLPELPADLGWDLPYNYFDARRILHGDYLIFFPDNLGREGMFFYLIAAVSKLGKLNAYSLRLTSALVGISTIPAIYALARECADEETAAYAAFLLATSKWHLSLTRSGYRVSLMPLFAILTLYGLARGLRRGQNRDWAWAGLFLGLGLWTYKAFTVAWPTFLLCTGAYILLGLRRRAKPGAQEANEWPPERWARPPKQILAGAGLALLVAVIAAMPMMRFIVDMPEVYLQRELHGARLVEESLNGQTSWLKHAAQNVLTSLLMFNYEGDGNSRFGVPFQRHLGFVSGTLFVLGIAAAIGRFRQGGNALLLLALIGFTAPMTVSMLAGEKPNLFRSSGTIGPALVLGAMTLRALRGELGESFHISSRTLKVTLNGGPASKSNVPVWKLDGGLALLPMLLIAAMLFNECRETSRIYFRDFRRFAPDEANYSVALEMAKAILSFEDGPAYIKSWPYWYDGQAVQVHLEAEGHSLTGELSDLHPDRPPLAGFHGKMLVLLHPEDTESLATLRTFFPRYAVRLEHFPGGRPSLVIFSGER